MVAAMSDFDRNDGNLPKHTSRSNRLEFYTTPERSLLHGRQQAEASTTQLTDACSSPHSPEPSLDHLTPVFFSANMADPFEVRMRFTTQLQHLSASTTSSLKCAHYALKHRDQDEDLHSCIIEQLERNNMNNRANIMYFLEHLCDLAGRPTKDGHEMYVKMIERDISRIVDAVAPKDGSGAANVKVVRTVLTGLKGRGVLGPEQVETLEDGLKGRDTRPEHLWADDVMGDDEPGLEERQVETQNQEIGSKTTDVDMSGITPKQSSQMVDRGSSQQNGSKVNGIIRVDKRVIEQRIEEDRERNKRLRESVWAVGTTDKEELDKMWEEGSELGIDDYIMSGEEAAEREQASRYVELE